MAITDLASYTYHLGGGLRANQFNVTISTPTLVGGDLQKLSALVGASNLPMMTTGVIQKKKRGRQIKLAGDVEPSGQWTVRVDLNSGTDAAHALHLALKWQRLATINKDPLAYKTTGEVELVDGTLAETTGSALKAQMVGVWVANVTEISLDDESVDEIIAFEMTLEYDEVIYL